MLQLIRMMNISTIYWSFMLMNICPAIDENIFLFWRIVINLYDVKPYLKCMERL